MIAPDLPLVELHRWSKCFLVSRGEVINTNHNITTRHKAVGKC